MGLCKPLVVLYVYHTVLIGVEATFARLLYMFRVLVILFTAFCDQNHRLF